MKQLTKKLMMVALAAVTVGMLTACGGGTDQKKDAAKPAADANKEVKLTFAAQEVGTAAYNYAAALQGVMLKELPKGSKIDITTTSPGGVGAPVIVNNAEEGDIVMSNAGPAKWSFEQAKDKYKFGGCKNIAAIAGGIGNDFVNIMFTKEFVDKTGCKTIEEAIQKKIPFRMVIKKNGTFGELSAEKVFEALGVTFKDAEAWGAKVEKTGGDAIKSGLQDGLYDITIDHIGAGQSNTTELCMTHSMYDVQLEKATMEKLRTMGYEYVKVPANTWKGQDKEITTVGSQQVVLVSSTMDDATAYKLAKAICEHKEDLAKAQAAMKFLDPAKAGTKIMAGAPVHPGALKYYKEKGYKVD